jgi:ATP/maltotriose-dependent transcriptional regulator MalT
VSGPPELALRHALVGQDWHCAIALLSAHWHEFAFSGCGDALRTALPPPPAEEVRADPALALAYAADRLDLGDRSGATTYLRLADSHRHLVTDDYKDRFALITGAFRLTEAQLGDGQAAPLPRRDVMALAPRHLLEADNISAGEELSRREVTVLHYLQSPLSNAEIASELCLSVHTVKTHIRNIFRKLGVARRRDAVRRARELQLL